MSVSSEVRVIADTRCEVGEGPLWHPQRERLIWFDIPGQTLFEASADGSSLRTFGFGEPVSAAGWIDGPSVLVAGASGLTRLNLDTGERAAVASLEADQPANRSNDGRVDLHGGFWIGTMDRAIKSPTGSLYRFHGGQIERLRSGLLCPNSIAFSPDGRRAYFADTPSHRIITFALNPDTGLPIGEGEVFLDFSDEGLLPDGSVVDAEGCLWNAQYGAGRVVRYRPDGTLDRVVEVPASNTTCPALGGPGLRTLFITTARQHLSDEDLQQQPHAGAVFAVEVDTPGQPENRCVVG